MKQLTIGIAYIRFIVQHKQSSCCLTVVCLSLLLQTFGFIATAQPISESRPNVLLIMIDDLRPELNCYGASHIKSPNIDRLAASGTMFSRAYCQYPVCSPSRASMLSGTRPTSTNVYDLYSDFRAALPDIQSLPELFKNNGYYTDRFGKIFHIDDARSWSPTYPKQQFGPSEPERRSPYASKELNEAGWKKFEEAKAKGLTGVALERSQRGPAYEITDVEDELLPDGQIATEGIRALQKVAKSDQPFFIAIGFHKPHLPFVAPRKYWDMYNRDSIRVADNVFPPDNAPYALGNGAEFYTYTDVPSARPIPDEYARIARHGYYACVSFVDAQVGRVLDELERLGLDGNTIVVLVGDHGFKLGEHGSWGKSSNFELDTRVPLIVRTPGRQSARVASGLVEMLDIYPTLAELGKIALPDHVEGKSFAYLLDNSGLPGKEAVFTQCTRGDRMGYSMRTDSYRFTKWIKPGSPDAWELYDAVKDPEENDNLATLPAMKELCERLSEQMDQMISVQFLSDALIDEP